MQAADGLVCLCQFGKYAATVLGISCACFGHSHHTGGSGQQSYAECLFEFVDGTRDHRRRNLQLARRASKSIGIDYGDENADEVMFVDGALRRLRKGRVCTD